MILFVLMAGHNKWSKIKRKKGVLDAKRSKIFSRIIKEITVAVKEGGSGDPEFNPRLRLAVANAKGANMPKDNVERAIKKALDSDTADLLQPTYEGYAPGGVAVFVECTTDNLNRTVSSVRAVFTKYEGNLATSGSVDFMFSRKGIFIIDRSLIQDMSEFELEVIDAGAEEMDIDEENNEITVTVAFEDFGSMQSKLEELGIEVKNAVLERIPDTFVNLSKEDAEKAIKLIDALEENDDVQNVFHNIEMTEEVAELM
jgi:YebC/PmpR family DNA-binding regulatory protein